MEKNEKILEDVGHILKWRIDVTKGEMIQAPGYRKEYMNSSFSRVSQEHLDEACKIVNGVFGELNMSLRVFNAGGEYRPGWA
jgi:hypothetical protein